MGQLASLFISRTGPDSRWCLVSCSRSVRRAFRCLLYYFVSATALPSLEIACDTILSGKAKVVIAGGFDDFSEEGSFESANMKATSNSRTEFAMGREPNEFSRPTTTTRAGVSFACSSMPSLNLNIFTSLVHGIARIWCASYHEREDSS
jgi:hypothetical protein